MISKQITKENEYLQQSAKAIDTEVLRRILRAIGETPKDVYYPSEDSFLMLDVIAGIQVEGKEVLDLGTGSGILGLFCALEGALVTATDVNEAAIRHAPKAAKSLGVTLKTVLSDLFSNVHGRFDLVLFNPPYLPSISITDRSIDGGRSGRKLAERFLMDLPSHLKRDGTALLLLSSLNDPGSLIGEHPEFHFSLESKRQLFFEELQVLRLRFREEFTG